MKDRIVSRYKVDVTSSDAESDALSDLATEVSPSLADILKFAKDGILAGCKKKGEEAASLNSRSRSESVALDWSEVEVRQSKDGLEIEFPHVMTVGGKELSKPSFELKVKATK